MFNTRSLKNICWLLPLLVLWGFTANAQLRADFSIDKNSGCSPLAAVFTNTTTGNSAAASYEWNLGNGNSSLLQHPGAVYIEAKRYTVTLTVRDSGKVATVSKEIRVYKTPVVDFAASTIRGCVPFPISFTSNAEAGDGTIREYFWAFGDGFTEGSEQPSITHTYTETGNHSVSLTVTNSHGCQSTTRKEKIAEALPPVVASFAPDKKVLCSIAETVRFTNNSTGPGTLSYRWEFGDGTTSTLKDPSHVYAAAGSYPVRLTVNSSIGCTDTFTFQTPINVANYKSEIDVQGPFCRERGMYFKNSGSPVPGMSTWVFDNGFPYEKDGKDSAYYSFNAVGPHTIQLTNQFGGCSQVITKTIEINALPAVTGFISEIEKPCGSPVRVNFKDTTPGAVKWRWDLTAPYFYETSDLQSPSFIYTFDYQFFPTLTVTNAAGCTASISKELIIRRPYVIIESPDVAMNGFVQICGIKPATYRARTTEQIATWYWDMGDGKTYTTATPVHSYDKPGEYRVKLVYTLTNGCKDSTEMQYPVIVRAPVKADFNISTTNICGNTPVVFTNTSGPSTYYNWSFGDGTESQSYYNHIPVEHKYEQEGVYTVRLIATDLVCADTITKVNLARVSPPFPKIDGYSNTCEGTRGMVTFKQSSRQAETWTWDFGDGTRISNSGEPELSHEYSKTGYYKVVLTTTNKQCTVKDSIDITVLLKQRPILTANKTVVCNNDEYVELTFSNLEKNPKPYSSYYEYSYNYYGWQYSDSTNWMARTYNDISSSNLGFMPFRMLIRNFDPTKEGFRAMTISYHFNCTDTTNFIPLKFKGPVAGMQEIPRACANGNIIYLKDSSRAGGNVAIRNWEWNFGDGRSATYQNGNEISHTYNYPGYFPVQLVITDAEGCTSYAVKYINAENNSLRASFTSSALQISPGTTVNFTNTSLSSDTLQTTYRWILGEGTTSTNRHAAKTYNNPGIYQIMLIATNTAKGCTDTARATLEVRFVNTAFTYNSSFISNSSCPPVLVQFRSTSSNITKITWDFGDSTIVNDVFNPSHVYSKGGKYKITVRGYSDNGTVYTTIDSVTINPAPAATLQADRYLGCTSLNVSLKSRLQNNATYIWDYGDGSTSQSTDSAATHSYRTAGIYYPKLIVKDTRGCSASVNLDKPIIIDSLNTSLNALPASICTPREIQFNPTVISLSGNQDPQLLIYHWSFGTGNPRDTANQRNTVFTYTNPGTYNVRLTVKSLSGCVSESRATINAFQGLGAVINGPNEICRGSAAVFTASTQLPGQPKWIWLFDDGTTSTLQNPPAKTYNTAGTYIVKLVADNNGCIDTLTKTITVHPDPVITLSAKETVLCAGNQLTIQAGGGVAYLWSPALGLDNTSGQTVVASPRLNATYTVRVTDSAGCSKTDSVRIIVAQPFQLQLAPDAQVCQGNSIQLNATGANTYKWINNNSTLNNTQIPNPVASPSSTETYTVIGTDQYSCFTDTATIRVSVAQRPAVNAGQDSTIFPGEPYLLQPTVSSDVTTYKWTPERYLSCYTCATPQASPIESLTYQLTVTNAAGCSASDSVSVTILCAESKVYIPNIFTPDNDGLNDFFAIKGQGIRIVHYLRIYNRFGQVIFEKKDFKIDDPAGSWNGQLKGIKVPPGTYIYMAEMSCTDQKFSRKGTVTVVY